MQYRKLLQEQVYPMSNDSVSSPGKASGGVHEQIESFLQTVMQGLMCSHDQDAAEQSGKPGHPVSRPSCEFVDGSSGRCSTGSGIDPSNVAIVSSRLVEVALL